MTSHKEDQQPMTTREEAALPLSEAMAFVLKIAARRPRGNVCPTLGLRGRQQDLVLLGLSRRGFIDMNFGSPLITEAGRAAIAAITGD